MPYSFVWSLYFACCQLAEETYFGFWYMVKGNKLNMALIWHKQLDIKFSCVWRLVWNQLCTNFHCTKMSKYKNNNICIKISHDINLSTTLAPHVYFFLTATVHYFSEGRPWAHRAPSPRICSPTRSLPLKAR